LGPWTCSQILIPWTELVGDHLAPCTKSFSLLVRNNLPGELNFLSKSVFLLNVC
jgi:hypothetical protein